MRSWVTSPADAAAGDASSGAGGTGALAVSAEGEPLGGGGSDGLAHPNATSEMSHPPQRTRVTRSAFIAPDRVTRRGPELKPMLVPPWSGVLR